MTGEYSLAEARNEIAALKQSLAESRDEIHRLESRVKYLEAVSRSGVTLGEIRNGTWKSTVRHKAIMDQMSMMRTDLGGIGSIAAGVRPGWDDF